jgi:hypothetical protein
VPRHSTDAHHHCCLCSLRRRWVVSENSAKRPDALRGQIVGPALRSQDSALISTECALPPLPPAPGAECSGDLRVMICPPAPARSRGCRAVCECPRGQGGEGTSSHRSAAHNGLAVLHRARSYSHRPRDGGTAINRRSREPRGDPVPQIATHSPFTKPVHSDHYSAAAACWSASYVSRHVNRRCCA